MRSSYMTAAVIYNNHAYKTDTRANQNAIYDDDDHSTRTREYIMLRATRIYTLLLIYDYNVYTATRV